MLPVPQLGPLQGNNTLDTFAYALAPGEATSIRLWHPVYMYSEGNVVSLNLTMTDDQMMNVTIMMSPFVLHAMCFWAKPTSERLQ